MKESSRRRIGCLILAVCMMIQVNVFAAVNIPENIRIGLESLYKDADKINIKSSGNIAIGSILNEEFVEDGRLSSSDITITKATNQYYMVGEEYNTLDKAKEGASVYGGIPVYIAPGYYKVYISEEAPYAQTLPLNNKRIAVYDENNQLILIAENDACPIEFQGIDYSYSFPVTTVGSRMFRGSISVVNGQSKGLTAVNTVDFEEYLYGVVPAEMVPSWHIEALKAQAVAARSMAIYQYNRHTQKGYNLVDTVTSQVYKGVSIETERTNQAVDETYNQVITYNGKIAEALYFSTSGGYTESAEDVWGNPIDYLVAMPDIYEIKPEAAPWSRTITLSEIQRCADQKNANIGQVQGVEIISRTQSGRVSQLNILGTSGTLALTKEDIRTFFSSTDSGSLRSRMFKFTPYDEVGNSGQEVPTQAKVVAMGKENITEINLSDAVVMSNNDIRSLGQNIAVQSSTGITEIGNNTPSSGNNTSQDEITRIYGDVTFYGKGFGHGVGMSQSGARGMADSGFTYEEILKYYYTGIEVQK